jgi:lysophospholipase L1-like esterase
LSTRPSADITNNSNIAAWGDSLTSGSGGGGTTYETALAALSGYTVYNGGIGGETSTQIKTRMLAGISKYGWPTIIWAGRNNYSDPPTVEADIAAMVSALGANQNYIVLSVLNGEYGLNEYAGGAGYNQIVGINSYLAATYGSHYLDVRSYLISLYNSGIPQDVTDHGHDIPPGSLRSDSIHLNAAGYTDVANLIEQNLPQLQNYSQTALTPSNVPFLLQNIPSIGASSGVFSQLSIGTTTNTDKLRVAGGNISLNQDGGYIYLHMSNGSGAGGLQVSGNGNYVQTAGSGLVPNNDNAQGLGISFQRWNALHIGTGTSDFAGSVGIGTTSPAQKFEVSGGNIGVTGGNLVFKTSGSTGGTDLELGGDGVTLQLRGASLVSASDNSYALGISTQRWSSLHVGTNTSDFGGPLNIAGNVGVGTTTPQDRLSVSGGNISLNQDGGVIYLHQTNGNGTGGLQVSGNGNYVQTAGSGLVPNNDDSQSLGLNPISQRWHQIYVGTGASSFAGKVGIGTTTPWAQVSVGGASGANAPLFVISTSTASATSTALLVDGNGRFGLATTTPWRSLAVAGSVGFDGLTGSVSAGSLCLSANK